MSSNKVNQYQIIEVSWEEKYLKGRTHPQSVRILTPGFLDELKKLLYAEGDESFHEYFDKIPEILERYPDPLIGELDYKRPLDFMDVYFNRPGMIACISERVKAILERQVINRSEYLLKPIQLVNQPDMYYVLFIPMINIHNAGIDFKQSKYIYNKSDNKGDNLVIKNTEDYLKHQDKYIPTKLVLKTNELRSIYHIESCIHIFYSKAIVESFLAERITGASVVPEGQFCSLCIEHL